MTGVKVYADLSLLVNFIMDGAILWTTARLSGLNFKWSRIAGAALLGAVYAVGFLFYPDNILYSLPLKIFFSLLMIWLAFYPQSGRDLKKAFLYFYLISFIAAGAMIGLPYLIMGVEEERGDLSIIWIAVAIAAACLLGWQGKKYLFAKLVPELLNFMVHIKLNGQELSAQGFLDTGNMLRDPLTDSPVVIAEYDWLKQYLPVDLVKVFENSGNESELLAAAANSSWAASLRLIPFSSLGRKNGLLLGIRADEIRLRVGHEPICRNNLVLAIYQEKLSREGEYQLLIPAEIVQKG